MDAKKSAAIQSMRNAVWTQLILGLLAVPVGYAISYWFQPGFLRAFCSLGDYFAKIGKVCTSKDTAPTAIIVIVVVVGIVGVIGNRIGAQARLRASEVLTEDEMRQYVERKPGSGNLVFGKIKEGEDGPCGSVRRIIVMLLIGLAIIALLMGGIAALAM